MIISQYEQGQLAETTIQNTIQYAFLAERELLKKPLATVNLMSLHTSYNSYFYLGHISLVCSVTVSHVAFSSPHASCYRGYYIGLIKHFWSSQNHRMVWTGENLKDHPVPAPHHRQGHLPQEQVAESPSNLALNTSRDWASITSLGKLFSCLTTLTVKFFLYLICMYPLSIWSHYPLSYNYLCL